MSAVMKRDAKGRDAATKGPRGTLFALGYYRVGIETRGLAICGAELRL